MRSNSRNLPTARTGAVGRRDTCGGELGGVR
jgi:hypothetical protein